MKVDESLTFEEYWSDRRFRTKRPRWKQRGVKHRGDNIYEPDGRFRQLPSSHYDHEKKREHQRLKKTDLGGERVLVGRRFCYYGIDAIEFPKRVAFKRPERYNRVDFTDKEKSVLLKFLEKLPQGIQGQPRSWPRDDKSWRKQSRCG